MPLYGILASEVKLSREIIMSCHRLAIACCAFLFLGGICVCVQADETTTAKELIPREATPINKSGTILIDLKPKRLLIKSEVALREGMLEMLACIKRTKEHESILAVDARAREVHAGLVALGAEPGSTAKFFPDYKPATGQQINIFVSWIDANGKLQREDAQKWVRHATHRYFLQKLTALPKGLKLPTDTELRWDEKHKELLWHGTMTAAQRDSLQGLSTDKDFRAAIKAMFDESQVRQMKAQWVFAGSGFNTDSVTGEKYYLAEGGDLICIANFATATIDLEIESSAANDGLVYEAYTERIPAIGTKVIIELVPVFKNAPTSEK